MSAQASFALRWPRLLVAVAAALAAACAAMQFSDIAGPWPLATAGAALLALIAALLPAAPTGSVRGRASEQASLETQRLLGEIEKYKRLERDLTASKLSAEAATMAKGEFLATMSHEIRTPLNGIIPLLDILMSTPLGPDQREYVQTAFGSAKQLLRIVDDILDYSKLEANKLELESVGLNLKDVVESVMRLMEKAAESKGLNLSAQIDPTVRLALRGDPVRLRQVLTNLLSNALKFTERGSVTLHISRRGESRTHHELRFEIRDTGVGIASEVAAKLFQPFSQADASTTRTYGGTGLGLVICKRIVDLMGGQIGVESQISRGSLFWFQVPLLKALGDIGGRKRELNGSRVLALTAAPAQQRRFQQALPNWGAQVVHAANTHDAIVKLRAAGKRGGTWAIDLLLVDAGSVPTTLLGLHRAILRESTLEELQLIYLRGDEDVPAEIVENERVRILSRDMTDTDLRIQIERCMDGSLLGVAAPSVRVTAGSGSVAVQPPATSPATAVAATPTVPSIAPAAPRTPTLAPDAPIRGHVLLVEDNPVNRQVAQRLLSLAGLTMDCAENGREALDRLMADNYDAVLMDCQMPVMDGYTATRQRRAFEAEARLTHVPIIAMTANAMVGDREKCLASGMDDYLSKPLNRALLEETLRRWLPATPAPRAAVAPAAAPAPAPPSSPPVRSSVPSLTRTAPAALPNSPSNAAPVARSAPPRSVAAPLSSPRSPPAAARPTPAATVATAPSAAAENTAPPLNTELVEDLREIMGGEFLSLVKVFLEDAPLSLQKLEAAAAREDVEALIGPAHSLKSTSANLGALALSEIARTIEHGARQRKLADPKPVVATLSREFRRVESALRGFLG